MKADPCVSGSLALSATLFKDKKILLVHPGNGKSLVARRLSERRNPPSQRRILQLHDTDISFGKIVTTWLKQVKS